MRVRARSACVTTGPGLRLTVLAALMLAACASGPDFRRPAPPADNAYGPRALAEQMPLRPSAGEAVQHFVPGLPVERQWWQALGSPELDALIRQAIKANPDLEAAQASLRLARETELAQRGALLPSAQLSYAPSRQKNPVGSLAPTLASGEPIFNLHTVQVSVGYVPDVFGGTRRSIEQAAALADVQQEQAEATYLTLVANIALAAIGSASVNEQISVTEKLIAVQREQRDLLSRQHELGAIAEADVLAQETALAQLEASLPALHQQRDQQQHLLSALCGTTPARAAVADFRLDGFVLPAQLPVVLPAQLVDRRPDVRAAEAQLHAASAGLGVAISNRLPQFNLSASYGGTSTRPGDLFAAANTFWSLAGSVAQTVFDGGALRHRERAADAALAVAAAQYRSTVLTSFRNVADTLSALGHDADAVQAGERAGHAAAQSFEVAERTQALGASGSAPVLLAQQALLQTSLALVQARAGRLADTVALFQALGGGGWTADAAEADGQLASQVQGKTVPTR